MSDTETTRASAGPPLWRGWFRLNRRQRWEVVAQGDGEQQTHDAMLDARAGRGGHFILLPGHQDANDAPRLGR
jgi:hypothetical protein